MMLFHRWQFTILWVAWVMYLIFVYSLAEVAR